LPSNRITPSPSSAEPWENVLQRVDTCPVPLTGLADVDLEIAHEPLDEIGPEPVGPREAITLRRRELAAAMRAA
jgi:hypothetical protein